MGRAGIEPAVKGIGFLPGDLPAAVGAGDAGGEKLLHGQIEPGVGALFSEHRGNGVNGFRRADGLAAVAAVEHGNGKTPAALAADAPVGALADHALHAVGAPFGVPFHLAGGAHGVFLEGVHGAEPLIGGAVQDGGVAAPAVGVLVGDGLAGQQRAAVQQIGEDLLVGVIGGEALVGAGELVHAAAVVHRHHDADVRFAGGVVFTAYLIVLLAVARRGVHAAGAGVQRDMVAQDDHAVPVEQRMPGRHEFELIALELGQDLEGEVGDAGHLVHAAAGQDIYLAVRLLREDIVKIGVQANGQVAGDRPGGGGPDHEIEVVQIAVSAQLAVIVHDLEFHIDRLAFVV